MSQRDLTLPDDRRAAILDALQGYFREEFDEELSTFRAEGLLTFMMEQLGPALYNAGIQDARSFLSEKLDDLDIEFTLPEG
mgnify:CR=1 FL=1